MEVSNKRVIAGFGLIFLLGVMFAIVNGFYAAGTGEPLPLIVYAISFVSIVIGAFIVVLFQWRIQKSQMERVLKILPKDQSIIMKILLENNNSVEQNKLVAFSGFKKVKISRELQKLQERGVIEKKNIGNTNLIVLKI